MPHTITATFPFRAWRSVLTVLTLGALMACGGGGGSEPPRFEAVNGVNGVRDNTTGITWARQLGDSGFASLPPKPSARDVLALADQIELLNDPLFGFLDSIRQSKTPYVVVSDAAPNQRIWVVDLFENPGRLIQQDVRTGDLDDPGYYVWYKLSGAATPMRSLINRYDGTVFSEGLTWQLCSVGTTYKSENGKCEGAPSLMTFEEAKAAQGGGWRLPTKAELQDLLDLSKGPAAISLMREPFYTGEGAVMNELNDLPYWTASEYADGGWIWQVNFEAKLGNGGVRPEDVGGNLSVGAFVRLVRGSR